MLPVRTAVLCKEFTKAQALFTLEQLARHWKQKKAFPVLNIQWSLSTMERTTPAALSMDIGERDAVSLSCSRRSEDS